MMNDHDENESTLTYQHVTIAPNDSELGLKINLTYAKVYICVIVNEDFSIGVLADNSFEVSYTENGQRQTLTGTSLPAMLRDWAKLNAI